jgi:hypothetical protein
MKRIVSVFAVLMLVAGMATAMPSMYGSYGLVRTISPENAGAMKFGIGFRSFLSMGDVDTNVSWMNINVLPEGYFAFTDMFELSVAPGYCFNQTKVTTPDTSWWTNGGLDTRIGLKASFKVSESFDLGAYAAYDYRSGKKFSDYYAWVNEAWEKDSAYTPTGAIHFTLIPGIKADKFKAHLNIGIAMNLDKYEVGDNNVIYPNFGIPFGLGMSYDAGTVMPFAEVTGRAGIDTLQYYEIDYSQLPPAIADSAKRGIMNNPFWVTGGVRFNFGSVKMDVGGEINLQTKDTTHTVNLLNGRGLQRNPDVDWQVFMGLAYAPTMAAGPKVPPTGIISGKVADKAGKGLAATVMAGGITANTDPATGAYTLSGVLIDKAPVEIKAEAKGYIAKQASVMLTKKNKKTPAMQDFTLELKPIPVGTAKGMIKDALTGAVLEGTVAFAGPKAETAKTAAGAYTAKLQIGNYNATSNVAGYINKKAAISIAENGTAMTDFVLHQNGAALPVNVIWTSATRYTTKSIDVANIVTALNDNPNAKITVKAYVDAVSGTATKQKLATKRADAVKAEIVKAGVAADRIVTEGIVVTPRGKTAAVRNANTKVEAVISE